MLNKGWKEQGHEKEIDSKVHDEPRKLSIIWRAMASGAYGA